MTGEVLKDIADKALMSKLKEVDTELMESKSVDKVSVIGEEIGVQGVEFVQSFVSESNQVGKIVCEDKIIVENVSIPETPCQKQLKEAYDTLARSIKMIQKESTENDKATKLAQATLFDKQREVNFHLDTIASLKKELELVKIENDRIDQKLMSYVASSYVLEQIVLDDESEKSEKAHSVEANVKYENVEKVFKLVELSVNEIKKNDFFSKLKKSFGTSCPTSSEKKDGVGRGQNKKNQFKKQGIGFEKKLAKQVVKPKDRIDDVFVAGPSAEDEKEYIFSQKAVDDFNAAQKLKVETVNTTFVEGKSLKLEDKLKSIFEIGESSKINKTSKFYPKTKVFENQSWIVKSKPSVEIKKMENVWKNESNLVKDDVVEFESELDKFLSEFPTINNKIKQDVKEKASNGLPKSILSRWIMDSGASRHMTGSLALLYDVKSINGSYVGFAGNQGGRIVGQGKLTNGVISFDKVNYIVELTNNLLSISQIYEKMKRKAKRERERENQRIAEKRGMFMKMQADEEKARKKENERIRVALSKKPKPREEMYRAICVTP
ncbi:uncharacterized protein LOC110919758 [Helianthus annuus]|uniref:uncharacterized protein LOC110919758 n=1 Tax=Helianthus annuus TaxID=4232 RepID=UPI001652EC0C|nr:uncharacterized protein LOC110919758 [Helianthus annuus]